MATRGLTALDPSNLGGAPIIRDRLGWVKGEGDQREWWVPSEIWKAEVCEGRTPPLVARTLELRGMLRTGGPEEPSVRRRHPKAARKCAATC